MANRVGEQLGNYCLNRLLGAGAFAEVYLGEHIHLGTKAAIKLLHTRIAEKDVTPFKQEARLLASLKHPHIVRILDFGLDGQTPYLVMDYAPKDNLRTRHPKHTPLLISTVVAYVKQITQALQYAHDRKIVHRDIKPENMLIGEHNEILLSDFGIAITSQSSRYQSTQDIAGTLAYMSPEQLSGHPCLASDQYSLGIVVYEWLSGTLPFDGSPIEMIGKHTGALPPPIPGLPSSVEKVIFKALEKKPEQRFASVQEFASALEQASLPTEEQPVPPLNPPQGSPSSTFRQRAYTVLISVLIVMLILGGIFGILYLLPKSPPVLFSTSCSNNSQSANTTIANLPATSTSPDGETIGLSEGATIFDLQRSNQQQEVQYKCQAAKDAVNNPSNVVPSLKSAISNDSTDAEAQIYLENWQVLGSSHPHITFVVGISLVLSYSSRNVLQGAFTAQKEFNDRNRQDQSKTLIILMIANVGGDNNGDTTNENAKFVAGQIVDQANKDSTVVGIMGWPLSAATINIQTELQNKGSRLPMLAACAASDYLTGIPHFSRVCPRDADQAQIATNFVLKQHKKNIAILYQSNSAWTYSLKDDFAGDIQKAKANIIRQESYTTGDQGDTQRALNTVLTQHPDAIFFAGYPKDLTILLNIIKTTPQASNIFIMGGSALSMTNAYSSPLPDFHNVYFTSFASPNEWDKITTKPPFFQEYKDHFGTSPVLAGFPSIDAGVMVAYDGMLTLLYASQQVLSTQNTITPSNLEAALKQITPTNAIQGVTGRIAFNSYGDQDQHKAIFVEHIDGPNLVIDEIHGCLLKDNCT